MASVDRGFAEAIRLHARWAGTPADDATYSLNRDFFDARLSAQDVTALLALLQAGAISRESFFAALRGGEWIDANRTFDDEQALIERQTGAGNVEVDADQE